MSHLVVCLLLFVAAVSGRHEKYEGHQVFRISAPASEILHLDNKIDILSATSPSTSNFDALEAVIRLSPEEQQLWLDYFEKNGIAYNIIIENLADVLRKEDSVITQSRKNAKLSDIIPKDDDDDDESSSEDSDDSDDSDDDDESDDDSDEETNESSDSDSDESSNEDDSDENEGEDEDEDEEDENDDSWSISWNTYYNHEEINALIDEIGEKYPSLVTVINAALTYEGRQIKYVRISTSRFEDLRKPVIVVNAGIHGRDWMTTSVALYIINQLVVDVVDSELIERVDWIIIPLSNPDGYEWTINEDRLWRKTRSLNHGGSLLCPGVDASRNFAFYWGTAEDVSDPCSEEYEGPSAFSEPESRVIRDAVLSQQSRAAMYISLQHERANMILYSWAQNGTLPSNGLSLHLNGINMATEIGGDYTVGNAGQVLSNPTGTGIDWTRALNILLTYIVELPESESVDVAFLAPPEQIAEVTAKTWAGIEVGARYVISLFS